MKKAQDQTGRSEGTKTRTGPSRKPKEAEPSGATTTTVSSGATPSSGATTDTSTCTWDSGASMATTSVITDTSGTQASTAQQSVISRSETVVEKVGQRTEDAAPSRTVIGHTSDKGSQRGSRSSRSARLKAELEARIKFERSELERAQAAAALAKTQWELARLHREDDSSEDDNERNSQVEPFVRSWVQQTIMSAPVSVTHPDVTDKEACKESRRKGAEIERDQGNAQETHSNEVSGLTEAIVSAIKIAGKDKSSQLHFLQELPVFDGDPGEWIVFKTVFEDTKGQFSGVQNVARLRRALKGTAKEAVKSLLFTLCEPEEIMKALERRFGRVEMLILAEIENVRRMPRLAEDCRNIGSFASRITNVVATIQALNQPQYLYSPELVSRIVEKLGTMIKFKWCEYRAQHPLEPDLQKMAKFLNSLSEQFGTSLSSENVPEKRKRPEFRKQTVHTAKGSVHNRFTSERKVRRNNKRHSRQVVMTTQDKPVSRITHKCVICNKEHSTVSCYKFKDMNNRERWEAVKKAKVCFQCLSPNHMKLECKGKKCGVEGCKMSHHRMLHRDLNEKTSPQGDEGGKEAQITTVSTVNALACAYLKIIPVELYGPRGKVKTTALLDEGSTMTLIEECMAQKLAPRGRKEELRIEAVGGKRINDDSSYRLNVKIKGIYSNDVEEISVQTIKSLNLSPQSVSRELLQRCSHLTPIKDELMYERSKPTILIGQDNWHLIVTRELISGGKNLPVASLTKLGWVLHGHISGGIKPVKIVNHISTKKEEEMDKLIKEYFSLESLGVSARKPANDPEERALNILNKTVRRIPNNRYETALLWRTDNECMPSNRTQVESRLFNIEKKLDKNSELRKEYEKQIENLIVNGYAEKANQISISPRKWYLPHFAVTHPQKKKIRIVFDAAARTGGRCLNDALLTGPDLLKSLFGILLRFREGSVAVMADIKEMFLQVKIREEDRDSLRFLWRHNRDAPPEEYRMTSLIFGAASSPCIAMYVKNRNAQDNAHIYPEAASATESNFYMDDYLQAFPDVTTAEKMVNDMYELHKRASFQLRGWASNRPEVLCKMENKYKSDSASLGDKEHTERTLGLIWNIKRDIISFSISLRNTPEEVMEGLRPPTKREITSAVMSVFDPLGLASPITIQGKSLIQLVWRTGISWDEEVSHELHVLFCKWISEVKKLGHLEVPRPVAEGVGKGELHTFTDASEKAYAAAVYYVTTDELGERRITLIAAKARVAPLKPISIPRLELQAALMGSRLAASVIEESKYEMSERVFWTDSRTVLAWIKSDPRTFKPFVAHRLAEIEDHSKPCEWRWVPTSQNVADDATRNFPSTFDVSHRWFQGPEFLRKSPDLWPEQVDTINSLETGEEKSPKGVNMLKKQEPLSLPDYGRFSSFKKFLGATTRTLQAVEKFKNLRKSVKGPDSAIEKSVMCSNEVLAKSVKGPDSTLDIALLRKAEILIWKFVQDECFHSEIKCLKAGKSVEKSSRLSRLSMEMGKDGLLRLNGRLPFKSNLTEESRKPVILDGKHEIVKMMIREVHHHFGHANHQTVMNEVNQKFYVLNLRNVVRSVSHHCQWCRTYKSKPQNVPQGNLPLERIAHHEPPFTCSAVDYFGPMSVTIGRRHEKRWGVLFTCLTIRAVHLELAASLTPASMIMALRRFIARRGKPAVIYSDNGTNFKAANKELLKACEECYESMKNESFRKYIKWKFIPPGAPHMGGAWERLVRSIKVALNATLKEKSPREEVLHTLLLEAEHTVNSRPLVTFSMDSPEEGLTPNHFLLGRSCGDRPPGLFSERHLTGQVNWKAAQRLADHFWTRWLKEYMPTLIPRTGNNGKFMEPKEGDIVLIIDHSLPRNTWPRGKISRTLPGPDGHTRVVDVITNTGILRRPTSRIIVLVPATPPKG